MQISLEVKDIVYKMEIFLKLFLYLNLQPEGDCYAWLHFSLI